MAMSGGRQIDCFGVLEVVIESVQGVMNHGSRRYVNFFLRR